MSWNGETIRHRQAQLKRFKPQRKIEVQSEYRSGKKGFANFESDEDRAEQYMRELDPRIVRNAWLCVNGEHKKSIWDLKKR